ncbi:flavodoxin family protein [Marinisporobacter balticus]|uniref:Multimeric flavodoxin WrbA n=1 Tax=Marinisporobacter balticus TaxID=2018667 RepID=A0A4R2KP95_9FIRM|nr:flavodoxin family protein [Marinisporobacter balticus]TCO74437.1 multimeric flavodoxin WrbA [Marinisporobacter balticus]
MTKKIIGICGSTKKSNSSSEFLLKCALDEVEKMGVETKLIRLSDYKIKSCTGCGLCMINKHCPILKDPEDQLSLLYKECKEADGFIFSSPVYALSLPAIWKNWFDRCEPCTDEDLSYERYSYDVVKDVKGKAFKGKVVGLISIAAAIGHEIAWNSFSPVFTCINLTVVANVGLSLFEYDSQPAVRLKPWAKSIKDAEFAINMASSLGKRVYETTKFFSKA